MKIPYVVTPKGKKLFTFHRHDFQMEEGVGIDGGINAPGEGYLQITGGAKVEFGEISDLIKDIRKRFFWTKNYSKSNKRLKKPQKALLKDLTTDHIVGILLYFTKCLSTESKLTQQWIAIHQIFLEELKFRKL